MILIDTSEPKNIVKLLGQSCPTQVAPLNQNSQADYWFVNYEGRRMQFNRVQGAELIGDLDSMEDELSRYYYSADESFQIIEGIVSPNRLLKFPISDHSPAGNRASTRDLGAKLYCYQVHPGGHIERGHSFSGINDSGLAAWIHRLAQCGIVTYHTINWVQTARLLAAIYRNEQKAPEEHNTLNRIYRPKVNVRSEKDMSADELQEFRLTKALMFLSHAYRLGIGEVKATAIARRYYSILDIVTAPTAELAEVEGIGTVTASKLKLAIGG